MITKTLIIAALGVSSVGGGSLALGPTAAELAAGPVRVSVNGESGFAAHMDPAFEMRLTVTLRNQTKLNIKA